MKFTVANPGGLGRLGEDMGGGGEEPRGRDSSMRHLYGLVSTKFLK